MTEDDDRLARLHEQLAGIDELPVEERAAVFDAINRELVRELDDLGEV